jgi:hypothetical protein
MYLDDAKKDLTVLKIIEHNLFCFLEGRRSLELKLSP